MVYLLSVDMFSFTNLLLIYLQEKNETEPWAKLIIPGDAMTTVLFVLFFSSRL